MNWLKVPSSLFTPLLRISRPVVSPFLRHAKFAMAPTLINLPKMNVSWNVVLKLSSRLLCQIWLVKSLRRTNQPSPLLLWKWCSLCLSTLCKNGLHQRRDLLSSLTCCITHQAFRFIKRSLHLQRSKEQRTQLRSRPCSTGHRSTCTISSITPNFKGKIMWLFGVTISVALGLRLNPSFLLANN